MGGSVVSLVGEGKGAKGKGQRQCRRRQCSANGLLFCSQTALAARCRPCCCRGLSSSGKPGSDRRGPKACSMMGRWPVGGRRAMGGWAGQRGIAASLLNPAASDIYRHSVVLLI